MHGPFAIPRRADHSLADRLRALAIEQERVARRDQLIALGLSRHSLDNMLDSYRWCARGQIVIVMHNGPLAYSQQLWAAVLNAGPEAALAARTAATSYGLMTWQPDCIEVVVRRGRIVPPGLNLDVKIHESRRFTMDDIHVGRAIPTVRIERALVDAAVWSSRARTACGILRRSAAAVDDRLTSRR